MMNFYGFHKLFVGWFMRWNLFHSIYYLLFTKKSASDTNFPEQRRRVRLMRFEWSFEAWRRSLEIAQQSAPGPKCSMVIYVSVWVDNLRNVFRREKSIIGAEMSFPRFSLVLACSPLGVWELSERRNELSCYFRLLSFFSARSSVNRATPHENRQAKEILNWIFFVQHNCCFSSIVNR